MLEQIGNHRALVDDKKQNAILSGFVFFGLDLDVRTLSAAVHEFV